MTTNPKKSRCLRFKKLQREKSALGVEAKKRLRVERFEAWWDVGGFVTDGVLGVHRVRLMESDSFGRRLAVCVDGVQRDARTLRGVARCMGEMVFKRMVARSLRSLASD